MVASGETKNRWCLKGNYNNIEETQTNVKNQVVPVIIWDAMFII